MNSATTLETTPLVTTLETITSVETTMGATTLGAITLEIIMEITSGAITSETHPPRLLPDLLLAA
jgi:hypothetical protein